MDDDATVPNAGPARRGARIAVATAVGVATLVVGATVAWAMAGGDDSGPAGGAGHVHHGHMTGRHLERGARQHHHDRLAPYPERYAGASDQDRAGADALVAAVRDTLAAYADVDAATAAGYRAVTDRRVGLVHYVNPDLVRDGKTLDPSRPEGLVYLTGGGDPVLVGAFFVAARGVEVPTPAGDLVVWHTHAPSCPAFFLTEGTDCRDSRRMLHVWTAETVELTARRTGRTIDVRVVDPFGAPFRASVERAG